MTYFSRSEVEGGWDAKKEEEEKKKGKREMIRSVLVQMIHQFG